MLQVVQQLDEHVLFDGQLTIDLELALLEHLALVRDLRIQRLEVVENGEVLQIRDDLAQRLGRFDDIRGSDLDLE